MVTAETESHPQPKPATRMKTQSLEFSLTDHNELTALTVLIAGLNQNEIPYTLTKDKHAIRLTISNGY